jgi:hypothetical protein
MFSVVVGLVPVAIYRHFAGKALKN